MLIAPVALLRCSGAPVSPRDGHSVIFAQKAIHPDRDTTSFPPPAFFESRTAAAEAQSAPSPPLSRRKPTSTQDELPLPSLKLDFRHIHSSCELAID
jgi:hypothetical protein